jgi:nucleoside-diphosphate-sugar epimerase
MTQTILGSGGAIGIELAKALKEYTNNIRLVSRKPEKMNDTDELMPADLLNPTDVQKAVRGSSVVYVTIGFPYSLKSWREYWPKFMAHVIDACMEHNCKLVFFDNIYMYDPNALGNLTEDAPNKPGQ